MSFIYQRKRRGEERLLLFTLNKQTHRSTPLIIYDRWPSSLHEYDPQVLWQALSSSQPLLACYQPNLLSHLFIHPSRAFVTKILLNPSSSFTKSSLDSFKKRKVSAPSSSNSPLSRLSLPNASFLLQQVSKAHTCHLIKGLWMKANGQAAMLKFSCSKL